MHVLDQRYRTPEPGGSQIEEVANQRPQGVGRLGDISTHRSGQPKWPRIIVSRVERAAPPRFPFPRQSVDRKPQ